jgi:MFS family permease
MSSRALPRTVGGRLWRHPDFLKLWTGQTISEIGSNLTLLALPTIVILTLHGGAFEVGLLNALQFAAFPLLGLVAGVWIDRLGRRRLMIIADLGRMFALGSIPLAFVVGALTLAQLYVVAVLTGIFTVFFEIAYQSYLPVLVQREELIEGNTKLEVSRSIAQVTGPLAAGLLIQLIGGARVVVIDAASFLVSVLSLVSIRTKEPAKSMATAAPKFLSELVEGLLVVFRNPVLTSIAGCTATWNLGTNVVFAVFLVFAYRKLHLSPGQVGIFFAVTSVGSIAGALTAGRIVRSVGLGRTLALSMVLGGLSNLGMPLAMFAAPLALISGFGFVQGVQVPVYNINQVSLRQVMVPDRLQGRMNATMRTIVWGTLPIGSLLGGVMGNVVGIVPTMLMGGAISLLAVVWILTGPVIAMKEQPAGTLV